MRKPIAEILTRDGSDVAYKSYRLGTHRTASPAATISRVRPLAGSMGITRIANVTGLDNLGIPVVMVCRPNSRSLAVAQGKGLELDAAKASGLMEAVETFHAETIVLPLKLGSYEELSGTHVMVDPSRLPASLEGQYHDKRSILWIEGQDLIADSPVWLPYEVIHTNYTLPLIQGSGCFAANTNGLASGNHLLEAISHGICEVLERDSTTLWELGNEEAKMDTVLDLGTVDDPVCCRVLEKFERADIDVRVWDTTSDVGIASFYCLAMGRLEQFADPEFGAGCHPARHIALLRALTEAAQSRTTYIAGSRDDLWPDKYEPQERAKRTRACCALMRSSGKERDFCQISTSESDTIRGDVDWTLQRLQSVGIEQVVVVDLSKQEFDLPVARVVIPGLEGPYKAGHSDYVPGARARATLRRQA